MSSSSANSWGFKTISCRMISSPSQRLFVALPVPWSCSISTTLQLQNSITTFTFNLPSPLAGTCIIFEDHHTSVCMHALMYVNNSPDSLCNVAFTPPPKPQERNTRYARINKWSPAMELMWDKLWINRFYLIIQLHESPLLLHNMPTHLCQDVHHGHKLWG